MGGFYCKHCGKCVGHSDSYPHMPCMVCDECEGKVQPTHDKVMIDRDTLELRQRR